MSYAVESLVQQTQSPSTVLIASVDVLEGWSEHVSPPDDVLAFADSDAQHALDVIQRSRPDVVVLEQMFAFTPRGTALVTELLSDSRLADTEIRLLSADRSAWMGPHGPTSSVELANLARPFALRPLRVAQRVKMPTGTEVCVDGAPVPLIDLSTAGAQIISPRILKPQQSVRIVVDKGSTTGRAVANIVWSSVEILRNEVTYRAGIEFKGPRPEFLATLSPDAQK